MTQHGLYGVRVAAGGAVGQGVGTVSLHPIKDSGYADCCQNRGCCLVIACGDGAMLPDSQKKTVGFVAMFINIFVYRTRLFSIGFGRNDDLGASRFQRFNKAVCLAGFVGYYGAHFRRKAL